MVSAALSPAGNAAKIIKAVREGEVALVISSALLAELDDVLSRPKLVARIGSAALGDLRAVIAAAPVRDDSPTVVRSRDPKDDYLIALAAESGADSLISGDKDLTVLTELVPPVLTPAAFVEQLEEEAGR